MRLRSVTLTLFLLFPMVAQSQYQKADSLENIIKTTSDDSARVRALNQLVTILRERNNTKAFRYAQQAHELAIKINYQAGLGAAQENLGWIYYRLGNLSEAFQLSVDALQTSELQYDTAIMARSINSIAAIYFEQKLFTQANNYFRRAYDLNERIGDHAMAARLQANIAYVHLRDNQFDSATFYAKRAYELSNKVGDKYTKSAVLRVLGDIDAYKKDFSSAMLKFSLALELARSDGKTYHESSVLRRIGNLYLERNEPDKALHFFFENVTLAKKYGYKDELESTYKLIANAFVKKKNHQKALEYQTAYQEIHDSLYNQKNSEYLALQQTRFDSEIKGTQIELLTKDAELKQKEINNQRVWIYFSFGCLTLVLFIVLVLIYNNQIKKRAHDKLAEKNREIAKQALQLSNMNDTKDKLFSIISHDLRGPLASLRGLMNLVVDAGISQEEFQYASNTLKQNLDSVQENLENLLYWAQSQLKGLQVNKESVSVKQIADDIIALYDETARSKDVTIINELESGQYILVDKNHLRMIFRNLLSNAIKFNSQRGLVTISQRIQDDVIEISVSDSGVGIRSADIVKLFNAETHFTKLGTNQEKGVGIGLLLIKEFIEHNEGTISVRSEEGKGTTFMFSLKLDKTFAKKEGALSSSF
jgi:two-component system sensor histidine kinase/response regulator